MAIIGIDPKLHSFLLNNELPQNANSMDDPKSKYTSKPLLEEFNIEK